MGAAAREMREALDMTPEEMNLAAHHLLSNEHSISLIGSNSGSIFGSSSPGGAGGGGNNSISGAFGGSVNGSSSFSPMHQSLGTVQSPPIPDNRLRRVATITTTNNKSQPSQNNTNNNLNSRNNAAVTLNPLINNTPTQQQQMQSPQRNLVGIQGYPATS